MRAPRPDGRIPQLDHWFLRALIDHRDDWSLGAMLRRKRFALFRALLARIPSPVRILDVGGTQQFWDAVHFDPGVELHVVLLNLSHTPVDRPGFESQVGNACDMPQFGDGEFDIVLSNSVIEHVGDERAQRRMASEIERVGLRYFVQTPNRGFPIEPHFLMPGFQFLPIEVRAFLLTKRRLGWFARRPDLESARRSVESIRLLSERELRSMFPDAAIFHERLLGVTKSLVAYRAEPTKVRAARRPRPRPVVQPRLGEPPPPPRPTDLPVPMTEAPAPLTGVPGPSPLSLDGDPSSGA